MVIKNSLADWRALLVHPLIRFLHRLANLFDHGLISERGSREVCNVCGAKLDRIVAINRVKDK